MAKDKQKKHEASDTTAASGKMRRKEFEKELGKLQVELTRLQMRISRKEGQRFTACRSTVSHQVGPVLVRQDVVDFHSVTYAGQALDGYPRAGARAH